MGQEKGLPLNTGFRNTSLARKQMLTKHTPSNNKFVLVPGICHFDPPGKLELRFCPGPIERSAFFPAGEWGGDS